MSACLPQSRSEWLLLLGAIVVAGVLRIQGMGNPLHHDEVYTWEVFASQPYATIVTHYPVPNNHIFHSILVRLSHQLFGQFEWTIRLPALLAGLVAIPVMFTLGRALFQERKTSLVAAWLLALLPVHIYYSHTARGYTLLVLFSSLAWFSLIRGMRGGAWWWCGYVSAGFLAAYTIPSGILYVFTLAVWSVATSIRRRDRRATQLLLGINALAFLLSVLAYWPIREQLAGAGQEWGVGTGGTIVERLVALVGVVKATAVRCAGGLEGGVAGLLALSGVVHAVLRRRTVGLHLIMVWSVPFLVALIVGIAGQPRTYLFLLPSFVLAAAYMATLGIESTRLRQALVAVMLAGLLWSAGAGLLRPAPAEGLRGVGDYLTRAAKPGDIIVSPFILDLEAWYYAKAPIQRGLASAAMKELSPRLLFVANRADVRFDLDEYVLTPSGFGKGVATSYPRSSFTELYASGSHSLYRFSREGQLAFPDILTWRIESSDGGQVTLSQSGRGIGPVPGLQLQKSTAGEFALHSAERVTIPRDGLLVLLQSRSDQRSQVTLYRVLGDADNPRVTELAMFTTAARPVKVLGRDKRLWYLEALLVPVEAGMHYGVHVRGTGAQVQYLADIKGYFFPYTSSP